MRAVAIPNASPNFPAADLTVSSSDLPRRIMLVEDEADTADSFARILEHYGHSVRVVHNGPDALFLGLAFRPEVVLLDIGLPFMNGFEVARKIRERFWGRETLIIATTSWDQEEDRVLSVAAGIDHHLVKPIALDTLRNLLATKVRPSTP